MCHTEEEIKRYLEILHSHKGTLSPADKGGGGRGNRRCPCCQRDDCFIIYSGYKLCENCGCQNGHVLGYYDYKDYDRLHFRKKSIYQRKYHYEKKVNQVSRRLELTDEQKCDLYNKLMEIDNSVLEILNKQFNRKRMISIFFLIKKILKQMGNKKYKLVYLNISGQTLEIYNNWWKSYKSLKRGNASPAPPANKD